AEVAARSVQGPLAIGALALQLAVGPEGARDQVGQAGVVGDARAHAAVAVPVGPVALQDAAHEVALRGGLAAREPVLPRTVRPAMVEAPLGLWLAVLPPGRPRTVAQAVDVGAARLLVPVLVPGLPGAVGPPVAQPDLGPGLAVAVVQHARLHVRA